VWIRPVEIFHEKDNIVYLQEGRKDVKLKVEDGVKRTTSCN
jgi:hypothetical protein